MRPSFDGWTIMFLSCFFRLRLCLVVCPFLVVGLCLTPVYGQQKPITVENIILVTIDGLRWQEVFRGLDARLIADAQYNPLGEKLAQNFAADTQHSSAEKLMSFLHEVVKEQGVLLGNRDAGSCAQVTNSWYFSYPGYNEILTGVADPAIDSNASIANPNVTVLEWLQHQDEFADRVAVFASWDVFPFILNTERSGLPVNVSPMEHPETAYEEILTNLHSDIPALWPTVRLDAFTHHYALSYLQNHKPRVLYVAYGETDDFAHDGRYDQYIMAANRTDRFIRQLWDFVQMDPIYRDKTALFITVDHGRGEEPLETWKHHASKKSLAGYMQSLAQYEEGIVGSEAVWMAAMGPGIAAQGMVSPVACAGSNQIAATLLGLLGIDYRTFNPAAGAPLEQVMQLP